MGYFQVRYDSRVINYDRRGFIRLATDVLNVTNIALYLSRPAISFQTSELGVTEHIEGDECKFAVWTGRSPMPENKIILKVSMTSIRSLV